MRIFSIFSRRNGNAQPSEPEGETRVCKHETLVPRWDSPEDMGKRDKVTHYLCDQCQATLSREEGQRLQAEAGGSQS
ncbi:MAG: hypothetical protein HY331_07030 [Chloroflexi bacterium]|nr:hypothetical protein [Chloroflexota bacterium]